MEPDPVGEPIQSDQPRREYEFDDHENNTFSDLAEAMRAVGKLLLVIGPVRIIIGALTAWRGEYASGAAQLVEGVCFFLIGNWTDSAADAYRRIVSSRGADITHLMSSMVDLKKIYGLQRTVLSIALGAMVLGGIVLAIGSFGGDGDKGKGKGPGPGNEKAAVPEHRAAPAAGTPAAAPSTPAPTAAPPPVPAAAPVAAPAAPAVAPAAVAPDPASFAKKPVHKAAKKRR